MNSTPFHLALLFLAVSPLAAATPLPAAWQWQEYTECAGDTTYAANSTYEANIRRLAAVLPAAVFVSESPHAYRAVGIWPYRIAASSFCRRRDGLDHGRRYYSCAACIAGAFREMEGACPYHKEAVFSGRNCTLRLSEVRLFGTEGVFGMA